MERDHFGFHKISVTKTIFDERSFMKMKMKMRQKKDFMKLPMKKMIQKDLMKLQVLLSIDLFKDVGQVVHVRLLVDCEGNQIGDGYVEFASSKEAEQALQKKYLHDRRIFPFLAERFPYLRLPMYCIDHQVWYEDYLARENRLIQEDEAVEEGFDETCDFAEEVALRKNRIFVYNLPPRIRKNNRILYYKNVGEVRRVRLVVNREGEHVGCAFVEFASAEEAKKALVHESKTLIILSDVVEMAPYGHTLSDPKYLEPLSLPIEEDYLGKQEVTKLFCGKKKTFSEDD
ncbi:unnamed protein product [Brassica oleracea]|uniref:(rape) hypothetical protein n=1 Tax=Brassica napus TaxID=3708 RepID=A0A816KKY0_BRANA|nr:unnamed protein product [Brassica napus]